MAKLNNIHVIDDGEYVKTITVDEYRDALVKKHKVKPMVWDEDEPAMDAPLVVQNLINKYAVDGEEELDASQECLTPYRELYEVIKADISASVAYEDAQKKEKAAEKDKKAAEKAAAEEKKKAEEQRIQKAQSIFGSSAVMGFQKAEEDFKSELESLRDSLPDGVKIITDGEGYGVEIDEDANEEVIGNALGYMMGAEQNSSFKASVIQFLVGDIANEAHKLGLYKSMIAAGKSISELVLKETGKRLSPRNIESYARMARTITPDLRNPRVDATAYLALSDAPRINTKPKKEEGEGDREYKKRIEKLEKEAAKYEEKRMEIASKLRDGYITVEEEVEEDGKKVVKKIKKDLTARKDVLPLIDSLKVEGGFKEEGDENKKSTADWLRQYFNASFALDELEGIHEKGKVIYHSVESEATTVEYSHSDLIDLQEEAKNNLINILFGDDLPGIKEGEVEYDKVVIDPETSKPKKDKDGNKVTKKATKKVYPKCPF